MSSSLDLSQVWIFRQPDIYTHLYPNNPYFIIMSPKTGLVWNVYDSVRTAGGVIEIDNNLHGDYFEQFGFYN